jgi:molybdate ABC transporter, periplasmic molybdate-binding protein
VSTSTKKDYGQEWIDLVLSEEGQALLSEAGFTPAVK